jgi:uncharacterized RDD family membrane protein YckC
MNAETQQNPYAPPQAEVSDIDEREAIVEPAGRGIRFGAAMIDGLCFIAIYAPILVAVGLNPAAITDPATFISIWGFISLVGLIALIVITVVLVQRNGQTIGKKLVGIKVVRSDGSRATLGRIFWLRNVVNAIPSAIPFVGNVYALVDHLFIFGDKRQCLHDKIADTIVVTA